MLRFVHLNSMRAEKCMVAGAASRGSRWGNRIITMRNSQNKRGTTYRGVSFQMKEIIAIPICHVHALLHARAHCLYCQSGTRRRNNL